MHFDIEMSPTASGNVSSPKFQDSSSLLGEPIKVAQVSIYATSSALYCIKF